MTLKLNKKCNYLVGEGVLGHHGFCVWRPEDNFLMLTLSVCSKNSPLPMLIKANLLNTTDQSGVGHGNWRELLVKKKVAGAGRVQRG